MKQNYVIRSAILSEKAHITMQNGIYTFLVDKRATKKDIKKAVEKQFSTSVIKVNVLNKSAKNRQVTGTRKRVLSGAGRKAIVYLKAGEKIAILSPKNEEKTSKVSKTSNKPKTKEKTGLLSKITKSRDKKVTKEEEKNAA